MAKLLFIDTETGGLEPGKHSLLTIALGVWEAGEIIDYLDMRLKLPEYCVAARAMQINKINLQDLQDGIEPDTAKGFIVMFLKKHFKNKRPMLVGQNVGFDVGFLKEFFGPEAYGLLFSHRVLDTAGISRFLTECGLINMEGASLDDAIEYFGIEIKPEDRHTALGDIFATVALFNKLQTVARFEVVLEGSK